MTRQCLLSEDAVVVITTHTGDGLEFKKRINES